MCAYWNIYLQEEVNENIIRIVFLVASFDTGTPIFYPGKCGMFIRELEILISRQVDVVLSIVEAIQKN